MTVAPSRLGWELVIPLTLGLLGWELGLLAVSPAARGAVGEDVGRALVQDALLLTPLLLAALGCAGGLARRVGPASAAQEAALLTLCFLLLALPVTVGRGLLVESEGPESEARRFLCATVRPPASEENTLVEKVRRGARDVLVLQVPVLPLVWLLRRRWPSDPERGAGLVTSRYVPGLVLALPWLLASDDGPRPETRQDVARGCASGARVRRYAVAAVSADLRLNAQGDYVPRGFLYALEEELPLSPGAAPSPLVLRANLGECLQLRFTNRLATGSAALHLEGLRTTVLEPDAGEGALPGEALPPGGHRTYELALPEAREAEGAYLLHDPTDDGAREQRGLFGALVLEPAGALYRDATTGEPLHSGHGVEALIELATGASFRERVLLHHAMSPSEEAEVRSGAGDLLPVLDEMAGPFRAGAFGIDYRSEPRFEREEPDPAASEVPEALFRSSVGESIRLRLVHAGGEEFHIPHVHGWDERWGQRSHLGERTRFERPRLLTPGGGFTLATSGSAPFPTAAGEFLLHCHMPNHTQGGERLRWRVSTE